MSKKRVEKEIKKGYSVSDLMESIPENKQYKFYKSLKESIKNVIIEAIDTNSFENFNVCKEETIQKIINHLKKDFPKLKLDDKIRQLLNEENATEETKKLILEIVTELTIEKENMQQIVVNSLKQEEQKQIEKEIVKKVKNLSGTILGNFGSSLSSINNFMCSNLTKAFSCVRI